MKMDISKLGILPNLLKENTFTLVVQPQTVSDSRFYQEDILMTDGKLKMCFSTDTVLRHYGSKTL